jgi:hypothetical protein
LGHEHPSEGWRVDGDKNCADAASDQDRDNSYTDRWSKVGCPAKRAEPRDKAYEAGVRAKFETVAQNREQAKGDEEHTALLRTESTRYDDGE